MAQIINIKRAYEPASPEDGFRIYADRLWPRGLSHETFHYDLWDKDVAPSTELRQWFHENQSTEWTEFEQRYKNELIHNPAYNALKILLPIRPWSHFSILPTIQSTTMPLSSRLSWLRSLIPPKHETLNQNNRSPHNMPRFSVVNELHTALFQYSSRLCHQGIYKDIKIRQYLSTLRKS